MNGFIARVTSAAAPVPNLPGGGSLFGVAAASAGDAWAVGEAGDPNVGSTKTLILHGNGSAWRQQASH